MIRQTKRHWNLRSKSQVCHPAGGQRPPAGQQQPASGQHLPPEGLPGSLAEAQRSASASTSAVARQLRATSLGDTDVQAARTAASGAPPSLGAAPGTVQQTVPADTAVHQAGGAAAEAAAGTFAGGGAGSSSGGSAAAVWQGWPGAPPQRTTSSGASHGSAASTPRLFSGSSAHLPGASSLGPGVSIARPADSSLGVSPPVQPQVPDAAAAADDTPTAPQQHPAAVGSGAAPSAVPAAILPAVPAAARDEEQEPDPRKIAPDASAEAEIL